MKIRIIGIDKILCIGGISTVVIIDHSGLKWIKNAQKVKNSIFQCFSVGSMQISDQKSENNYYVDKTTFQRIAQEKKTQ